MQAALLPTIVDKLTLVIPAHNEEQTIAQVIADIYTECIDIVHEVIIVDDGSTDNTAKIVAGTQARLIRHTSNRGYGAALKTGIKAAQTEYILTMDSDGQHKAHYIRSVWEQAVNADMVVGQRMSLIHSPLWRMPGKWVLGTLANYIAGQRIPDLNSGFRMIRRSLALKYMHLCPSGFSFSTTITMAFFNRGLAVHYVPIEVQKRSGRSKVSVTTGFQTLLLILRLTALFAPLRIFLPFGFVIGLFGLVWGIPPVVLGRGVSVGSMLAIVTAILLFALGLICDQISQLRLERYE